MLLLLTDGFLSFAVNLFLPVLYFVLWYSQKNWWKKGMNVMAGYVLVSPKL